MNKLQHQLLKARSSAWNLWLLNFGLWRMVPFNRPHRLRIIAVDAETITIQAKNIRPNRNHIGGIHACLLATACEYVSGLSLLARLDPKQYRIILKSIGMTYHYQAKTDISVRFTVTDEWFEKEVIQPLRSSGKIFKEVSVDAFDTEGNHICTGKINWQIKSWEQVKTKPG
ncbi:hypothetical protein GCM10023091_22460 [Ravibacter arvi]|uniref:DUF4442 domain-containing protein n=1 Tax=Ravibacter arvi TaxID=2051041 RepID=A0ABP8M0U6_9BACT